MNYTNIWSASSGWRKRRTGIIGSWFLIASIVGTSLASAGTRGKISGSVIDETTKEPLVGVNIFIEGTSMGASSDVEGRYNVLNVPPGTYTLKASAVGYHPATVKDVKVSADLTTEIGFTLLQTTISLDHEVVITAERPLVQKDQTSTSTRVSAEQIKTYPVEDIAGLINLQAGVVEGHFRGGRLGEVLYMIDGIPVTDLYRGVAGVSAETNSIQELEVISGTFNAEYGQAMSGVVNQVTKDGGDTYTADVSVYSGDYASSHSGLFQNINHVGPADIYNVEGNLGGPVPGIPDVTFFASGRHYYNDGYLYGKRMFLPTDSSNFSSNDPSQWYVGASGNNAFVPMNSDERTTFQGKITIPVFSPNKLRVQYLLQNRDFRNYDHRYKYDPDGTYNNRARGKLFSVSYTAVVSSVTFLDLHTAWFNNREDSYVYEDPYDPRFPDYRRALAVSGPAFLTGGAEDLQLHRESRYLTAKADLLSQITFNHQFKTGFEAKWHRIWIHNFGIRNDQSTNFTPVPVEFGSSEFAHTIVRPVQYAAYAQDKMEFEDLIVNVGVRFDYFHPKADVLTQQLRLGQKKRLAPAPPENQVSPRVGLAFPITDRGVLHLSYGHFFQIPQLDLLYLNPAYNINVTEAFQVGNPGLRSQRTVAYELGLQQQLSDNIKLDATAYYKDFRNLIGTEIFDIGNGNKYAQYVNRDYGNTRGIILSLEKRHSNGFSATLDYTFQIAQGNASDPNSVFLDNQTDPPVESQKQLAPLDWDRRHSLNATATIGEPTDYTVTIVGRLGSGLPYTPAFQNQRTGILNSESRPLTMTVDLYATKYFVLLGNSFNLYAKIYNVFDTQNELDVFSSTGRANYSLEANYSGAPRGINTIEEYYTRPDYYSAPRQIVIGFGVSL